MSMVWDYCPGKDSTGEGHSGGLGSGCFHPSLVCLEVGVGDGVTLIFFHGGGASQWLSLGISHVTIWSGCQWLVVTMIGRCLVRASFRLLVFLEAIHCHI